MIRESAHLPLCVVNADDFGHSSAVNRAVQLAFERGLITSATLMANMPGFAEACAMARDFGWEGRLGVHLNLTEGRPITDAICRVPRFADSEGVMTRRSGTIWHLTREEARAVETELAAQIEAVLEAGLLPSHLDSHHHIHAHWAVASVVMRLAVHYHIPAIRLSRNVGPGLRPDKRIYKAAVNRRFAGAGLARTDRFGSARDAEYVSESVRSLEIMVHPTLGSDGRVVDVTDGSRALDDVARTWRASFELMSYSQLCQLVSPR